MRSGDVTVASTVETQGKEMLGAAEIGMLVLVVALLALVFGVLIGGLFLRWSVRLLQDFSPGYGRSLLVVLAATVSGFILSVVLILMLGLGDPAEMAALGSNPDPQLLAEMMGKQALVSLVNFVLGLGLVALFVHLLIRQPDGSAIGFGRALLIALLYVLMAVVLMVVCAIVLAVLLGVLYSTRM